MFMSKVNVKFMRQTNGCTLHTDYPKYFVRISPNRTHNKNLFLFLLQQKLFLLVAIFLVNTYKSLSKRIVQDCFHLKS
jgi:hypothetical protein